MNAAVAEILLPSLTRFAVAATGVTGTPDIRERLRQAEAEDFPAAEARVLGADLDRLAVLLTR